MALMPPRNDWLSSPLRRRALVIGRYTDSHIVISIQILRFAKMAIIENMPPMTVWFRVKIKWDNVGTSQSTHRSSLCKVRFLMVKSVFRQSQVCAHPVRLTKAGCTIVLMALLMLLATGCDPASSTETDTETDTSTAEGQEESNPSEIQCTTAADCEGGPIISVWTATCDGDVLQTPEGTGEPLCLDGVCSTDFALTETDCAAEGLICGPSEEPGAGDACVTP